MNGFSPDKDRCVAYRVVYIYGQFLLWCHFEPTPQCMRWAQANMSYWSTLWSDSSLLLFTWPLDGLRSRPSCMEQDNFTIKRHLPPVVHWAERACTVSFMIVAKVRLLQKLTISFVRGDHRRFALQKWWLYIVPKKSYRVRNNDVSLLKITYG